MYSMSLSPSLLALLLISVAFGAADGFGISEIKIFFKDRLLFEPIRPIFDHRFELRMLRDNEFRFKNYDLQDL